MLIHSEVLNNTEMLKLKIDMLAWIGMLPQSYVTKVRDKIKQLSQALAGPYIDKDDHDLLMAINENMNGGLEILLKQIPDDHNRACSNCGKVLEVCTMLYEGSPIEYIRQKINDNWGDITAEDAPPSPLQVTAIPLPHGGGSAIEALIMGMMSSALRGHSDHPDNSDDRMNFPDSMVPVSSLIRLLDSIIGTIMPEPMHPEEGVNLARAGREFNDDDIKDVNLQAFPMPDKDKLN